MYPQTPMFTKIAKTYIREKTAPFPFSWRNWITTLKVIQEYGIGSEKDFLNRDLVILEIRPTTNKWTFM